jgi:hypothetical protein
MILRQVAAGLSFLLMIFSFHISCVAGTTEEITSLLLFVEQSGCTFIRNGKHYDYAPLKILFNTQLRKAV